MDEEGVVTDKIGGSVTRFAAVEDDEGSAAEGIVSGAPASKSSCTHN